MISFTRIMAIVSRHLTPTFRDPMRVVNMLYWPSVDLILIGFLTIWSQKNSDNNDFTFMFLTGFVCWIMASRIATETVQTLLYDFWEHHIVNLFATPISITELICGLSIVGIIQALITFLYSCVFTWFVFSKNIIIYLPTLLPFILLLIISGVSIAFFSLSGVIYFGKKVEVLAWTMPWLFAIISGAYYSFDLFPDWFAKIAYSFPLAWIFDGIRIFLKTNSMPIYNLLIALALSLLYLALTFGLLLYMFKRSKQNGLSSLE